MKTKWKQVKMSVNEEVYVINCILHHKIIRISINYMKTQPTPNQLQKNQNLGSRLEFR